MRGAIALVLVAACGGTKAEPREAARPAPPAMDAGPLAPPDATPPTACSIYQTSVARPLGLIEMNLDALFEARDPARQQQAALRLAVAIGDAHKTMALIKTDDAALDAAHLRLLATMPPIETAMQAFAGAQDVPARDSAMADFRTAVAGFIRAYGDIRQVCPDLH